MDGKISQIRIGVGCANFKSDVRILSRVKLRVGCSNFKTGQSRMSESDSDLKSDPLPSLLSSTLSKFILKAYLSS